MIEKRITHHLLEAGELTLTERERDALSLPEHSTSIDIELDGEPFHAQWSGRSRQLTGDVLAERLQDYGQDGGLLRLRRVDRVYRLQILPPGAQSEVTTIPPLPPPVNTAKRAKTKRRATVDRQFHADSEYDWGSGSTKTIGFLKAARELLGDQLKAAGFDPLELVELRLQGEELATLDDFEELLAVDVANVDRMPHQESVARHGLSRLRGRAVLADEVGLGKTIEAGLAVKELALRGLAKRVLILCPAPLRDQWREEMSHKFDIGFDVAYRGPEIRSQDRLILSLTLGRSNADRLTKKPWDVVIIDEAHRAAGQGAKKTRDLITSLTTACRYAFFLTATPVQNDLLELYRLVELLRPGTFESVNAFKRQFMQSYDPRTPNDPAALRRLISSVMVRTTRAQAGVDRVTRRAVDVPVDLGPRERELYALSTYLLRNVMRDTGDTMRRRSLALRLTASPFSMGTTALRMADRHPDARVRDVLGQVGHLAMDIQGSARENKAVDITRQWLREHGRVLIFTQHTDTVTGLLRRMEAEGLTARSFHGSMSAGERAATIAAFRSGDAPIMISTDAGAEGQNLQFCNCVLNYDLPWNPMRIEQRIGRVDRLTQPKDEVFIANLYARGTIDESVYRLLAEKLRMFELLFGQVTTILGELDDTKAASFESRVLEALFAADDKKMEGLLGKLGTELAHAREKASELIAADSGTSSWMASAFEHRKGLSKAGSNELAPEVSERTRMRQIRVQTWVRRVLKALDARLLHDTGDGVGAFITAQFDEEFQDELSGRTLMHLAFDRIGLEQHPDAELCAVGSPVFDELLGLLRMRGDMHTTIPVIPDDIGPSPYIHSPTVRLVRRRLVPSGSWSGQATFRATVGESETNEHLITADINGHREQRLPRRPLSDGESLTAAFDAPTKVIRDFERSAAGQLESLRRERARLLEAEQSRELKRIAKGYSAQIEEASGEDRQRLKRALNSEERRLSRRPDVRARAKLLAVTLDEDDWDIEEVWAGPSGDEATLTYEYGLATPPAVESRVTGRAIGVLALCSSMHWIDEAEAVHCSSCDEVRCEACGDDARFAPCAVCEQSSCGRCRRDSGGLCRTCAAPHRTPEHDDDHAIAWSLNRGLTLRVGERVAQLIRPGSAASAYLVDQKELRDTSRIRLRSYAQQHGLPVDCGLVKRDLTGRVLTSSHARARLTTSEAVAVELSVAPLVGSEIDPQVVTDLPVEPNAAVSCEDDFALGPLLRKLRADVPPPPPPAVVVTHRSSFEDVYLEAEHLVCEASCVADDGSLEVTDTSKAEIRWLAPSVEHDLLAEANLANFAVSLWRKNEAVLVSVRQGTDEIGQLAACPDGLSVAEQLGCYDFLRSLGMPGGRLGKRSDEILEIIKAFPSPSESSVKKRDIRQIANLVELDSDSEIVPADSPSLAALGIEPNAALARSVLPIPPQLAAALLERTRRPFTAALCNGLEVTEIWQGHGLATHTYQTFDGEPVTPRADDIGLRQSDFGVCRDGHFYSAGTAALCTACGSWACRACDTAGQQASIPCPECSHEVCRRCLTSMHNLSTTACLLCSDHACSHCGRDPGVVGCAMCDRSMCTSCRVGDLCPACSGLESPTEQQRAALPAELAAAGASLLVGVDDDAVIVVINRGHVYEQAIVRGANIDRWLAFGRSEIDDHYRLALAASLDLGVQVVPTFEALEADTPRTDPHLVVLSERKFYPAWSISSLGLAGKSTETWTTPNADLTSAIAAHFSALAKTPNPITDAPKRLKAILESLDDPATSELIMRWQRSGRDAVIVPGGVCEITIEDAVERESLTNWRDTNDTPSWVIEAWNPSPAVRMFANVPDVEAVIATMATAVTLGVRTADQTDWYIITASENACAATLLARQLNLGDADEVGAYTDPSKLRLSVVSNAASSSVSVTLRGVVVPHLTAHNGAAIEAVAALAPDETVSRPTLQVLPHGLRDRLRSLLPTARERFTLDIGASVIQTVALSDGNEWRYEVALAPGRHDARRIDHNTRQPVDFGGIDREGHFGLAHYPCGYCGQMTCAACMYGLVACDCCGGPICKRCVREPFSGLWLCHACADTRPPTRQEAREHGRLLFKRGMLIGTDPLHTVVLEQAKSRWEIHGPDNQRHAVANPSVARYLDERLAQAEN